MGRARPLFTHHAGFTVRDLDASLAWWKEMFGIEPLEVRRGSAPVADDVATTLGAPGTTLSVALLAIGDGQGMLELLEYQGTPQRDDKRRNADVGAGHVAVVVDDLQAQYHYMREHGAEFRQPPIRCVAGPFTGGWFTYVSAPDGVEVELLQAPERPV